MVDVIEKADAKKPEGGSDDDDARDVFADELHRTASVGVRSEENKRAEQQQSPQPTPFHEKHVEDIVFGRHVRFDWW